MTESASGPDPANIPTTPIVITGGGSAGHVIPALPVVDRLLASGYVVHFIGTRSGLEQGYLAQREVVFHGIAAGKLRRYWSWQNFSDLFRIAWAVLESLRLLYPKQQKPVPHPASKGSPNDRKKKNEWGYKFSKR